MPASTNETNETRLNDFVSQVIQTNGIVFVMLNYLELREAYYEHKQATCSTT